MSDAKFPPVVVARFWSKVDVQIGTDVCWEWQGGKCRDGYGNFKLNGRATGAHRIAYELHYGEHPGELHVCHRCDNRSCVNPYHLFLGTPADNSADMAAKGRAHGPGLKGEDNPSARLTEADVLKIRELIAQGLTNIAIARRYGVTHSMISAIRRGKAWAHVQLPKAAA